MIIIAQTEEKQYHVVEVPMDAEVFELSEWEDTGYDLLFRNDKRGSFINLGWPGENLEIIGIQGGGESLSPEKAKEVVLDQIDFVSHLYTPLEFLKFILDELGLETENPYKKPELSQYKVGGHLQADWYYREFKIWEQAESKLKKVVIIRSDK